MADITEGRPAVPVVRLPSFFGLAVVLEPRPAREEHLPASVRRLFLVLGVGDVHFAKDSFAHGAFMALPFGRGDGGLADTRRALRYYRFSARQGNVDAQCYLATALIEGDGGTQDVIKGVELLNEAIEQGSVAAFYHAGHYLLDGEFVEQDIDLAHKFFTEASKKGLCLADEVLENWDEYTEIC